MLDLWLSASRANAAKLCQRCRFYISDRTCRGKIESVSWQQWCFKVSRCLFPRGSVTPNWRSKQKRKEALGSGGECAEDSCVSCWVAASVPPVFPSRTRSSCSDSCLFRCRVAKKKKKICKENKKIPFEMWDPGVSRSSMFTVQYPVVRSGPVGSALRLWAGPNRLASRRVCVYQRAAGWRLRGPPGGGSWYCCRDRSTSASQSSAAGQRVMHLRPEGGSTFIGPASVALLRNLRSPLRLLHQPSCMAAAVAVAAVGGGVPRGRCSVSPVCSCALMPVVCAVTPCCIFAVCLQ